MTLEEEAQMTEVFDGYPTTYSYRKGSLIGKGACCKVYRAMKVLHPSSASPLLQCPNGIVALKEMILSESKPFNRRAVVNEVKMMKRLKHDNCIEFQKAVWEIGQDKAWIVMEYADCGDLTELIDRVKLREDHMATFCKEVSSD